MKITVSKTELPLVKELKEFGDKHEGVITVAVHSGKFHADELIAIAILKDAMPEYHFDVIRTRKPSEIASAAIAIDVGGGRFDHHGATMSRYGNHVPLASCGKILAAVESSQALINVMLKMSLYSVQAIDNGERVSLPSDCRNNYFEWVASFNPTFEERTPTDGEYYEMFDRALNICVQIYRRMKTNAIAILNSTSVLRRAPLLIGGRFVELPNGGIPWHQYINENQRILGVIHKDIDDTWKVKAAPLFPGSKEMRVSFPPEWGGLEGCCLERISGIKGAVFCHRCLHVACFKTREAALAGARILNSIYHMNDNQ